MTDLFDFADPEPVKAGAQSMRRQADERRREEAWEKLNPADPDGQLRRDYVEQIVRDTATLRMDPVFYSAPDRAFYVERIAAYRTALAGLPARPAGPGLTDKG